MSRNIRSITKRIMKHQIATDQTSQITSCNIPECRGGPRILGLGIQNFQRINFQPKVQIQKRKNNNLNAQCLSNCHKFIQFRELQSLMYWNWIIRCQLNKITLSIRRACLLLPGLMCHVWPPRRLLPFLTQCLLLLGQLVLHLDSSCAPRPRPTGRWTCARGAAALCPTGLDSASAAVARCIFLDAVYSCEPPATAAAQESKSVTERGVLRGNEPMRDRLGRLVGRIWGCSAHFENTID
jgi:hypothetical protein